jgi:hypothetical protein
VGVALAVILAVIGSAATSCGLPADESAQEIDNVLFDLDQTTTTSTTTTTTLPEVTAPPVEPVEPVESAETTTTLVATTTVPIFYVIGFADLVPQSTQLTSPVQPLQIVAQLENGPAAGPESIGLRTLVAPGLVADVTVERGVASVDLDGRVLNQLSNVESRTAIGQLVLSLRLPGIGQVRFTTEGEPEQVPVPSRNNQLSDPGEELAFEDFEPLLADRPSGGEQPTVTATATTTSTTSTTSTTVPETDPPPLETEDQ